MVVERHDSVASIKKEFANVNFGVICKIYFPYSVEFSDG